MLPRLETTNKLAYRLYTNDLTDMQRQSEKWACTERDSNEHRVINYEWMKNNGDINSSDVTKKSARKLNETDVMMICKYCTYCTL